MFSLWDFLEHSLDCCQLSGASQEALRLLFVMPLAPIGTICCSCGVSSASLGLLLEAFGVSSEIVLPIFFILHGWGGVGTRFDRVWLVGEGIWDQFEVLSKFVGI